MYLIEDLAPIGVWIKFFRKAKFWFPLFWTLCHAARKAISKK
tara:strand:- start:126 stop:251 length:126 start_codon:yes stop_codon:yes gene_type:complete